MRTEVVVVIPTSISATAMQVATQCIARYAAENIGKNRAESNSVPAMLGTACHGALETYVKTAIMQHDHKPELQYLLDLYRMQYMVTFDAFDAEGPVYDDGVEMLTSWFERTVFDDSFEVVSTELKSSFPVIVTDDAGTVHKIPFNYIWDRCDRLDAETIRVIDYKTWRQGIQPDDLVNKLQARAYALAAQIQFPEAKRIWVVMDQLRYDTVGRTFSKEENIATWRFLQRELRRILNTPVEAAKETINPDCRWCIRKVSCDALKAHQRIGSVTAMPVPEMIDRRAQIEFQLQALEWAAKELDGALKNVAETEDTEQLSSPNYTVYWSRSARRGVSRTDVLKRVLPAEIWDRIGKETVSVTDLDKLLKGSELTEEQKAQLRPLIVTGYGEPKLKTKPINKIDGGTDV